MAPSAKPRAVTSRDVARAANVSQSLVSRAISGNGRIARETRDHILEVARKIGWQPNALARSMVTGDAPLVAVITTRLHFEWRAQVLSQLLHAIQQWQLKPLLFYADKDEDVDRLLAESLGWRTRGVIVTAGTVAPQRVADVLRGGQFFAALNRSANHTGAFSVATDNPLGGRMAAQVLLAEGRRRFLVLAGQPHVWASRTRTQGFLAALAEAGHTAEIWNQQTMEIEAGRDAAARYLSLQVAKRFDAVFSTNDAMAIGFLDALRGHVAIPGDLSLIGYDNLAAAAWPPYQLSTLEQPLEAMLRLLIAYVDAYQSGVPAPAPELQPDRMGRDGTLYCAPTFVRRATTRFS